MEQSLFASVTTIIAAVALALGPGLDTRSAAPRAAADMAISGTIEESRALSPEVFIGRVAPQDSNLDFSDVDMSGLIRYYRVDIETSLKGEARGRVKLAVGPIDGSPEEYEGDPVVFGGRYLFAAQLPEDDEFYWIDEGVDSLAIANDEEEAAAVARYRFLIAQLPPAADPDAEPCYWLMEGPTLTIDRAEGKAGQSIRVRASEVSGPEVYVYWNGLDDRVGEGKVNADCTTTVQIAIPADATPGEHRVMLLDGGGWQADAFF